MIVRARPSAFKMFLVLRGSVLPRILPSMFFTTMMAVVVTMTHGDFFSLKITLTTLPFTLIGLPLAIFLGFRNSVAYDRYWEARKLWGELLLRSRNLSRQCRSFISGVQPVHVSLGLADVRVRLVMRAIAFAHALRLQLRDSPCIQDLKPFVQDAEFQGMTTSANKADFLMLRMGDDLRVCLQEGHLPSQLCVAIDETLSAMTAAATSCERIKNTPIPFSYTLLLHRTAYLYCFLLPFGLVDSIGFMTPFVVAIVSYTFFGLDALGDEIEEPFGLEANDLALDAICRTLEISLRESLGDPQLLLPLLPVKFTLT